jgi:hypothetical protein
VPTATLKAITQRKQVLELLESKYSGMKEKKYFKNPLFPLGVTSRVVEGGQPNYRDMVFQFCFSKKLIYILVRVVLMTKMIRTSWMNNGGGVIV